MRRILLLPLVFAGLLASPVIASAQTTQTFDAHFRSVLSHKAPLCPNGAFLCGSGSIAGFGPASYSLQATSLSPAANGCEEAGATVTVTLSDGSGTLTADAQALGCFPGNSHNAPGSLKSFGNPFRAQGTFTITGGTGAFAGASGSGTATVRASGAQTTLDIAGTITL